MIDIDEDYCEYCIEAFVEENDEFTLICQLCGRVFPDGFFGFYEREQEQDNDKD